MTIVRICGSFFVSSLISLHCVEWNCTVFYYCKTKPNATYAKILQQIVISILNVLYSVVPSNNEMFSLTRLMVMCTCAWICRIQLTFQFSLVQSVERMWQKNDSLLYSLTHCYCFCGYLNGTQDIFIFGFLLVNSKNILPSNCHHCHY